MKSLLAVILTVAFCLAGFTDSAGFTYNGFQSASNFNIDGVASITGNGLLLLTNSTVTATGHALYPDPITFKDSANGPVFSFSTTFVFAIRSDFGDLSAHGLAFVISAKKNLPGGASNEFLGFMTNTTAGNTTNHVFAVEIDTIQNADTADINDNHVGIDVNSAISVTSQSAGYYPDGQNGAFRNVSLVTDGPTRVWVDYNGAINQITVTLAPGYVSVKPGIPLLNLTYDLSPVLQQEMYVGFSSTTGPDASKHYILGWSFATQGDTAQNLNLSELPKLPRIGPKKVNRFLTIGVPLIALFAILVALFSVLYYLKRKMKFAEVLEDWEIDYGPQRFKYKDLYTATRGFKDSELLGAGGFGRVYKGVLSETKTQIAVKRISHQSRQGMREFVAEIASIGRMSHRNLVPLLGYCRRKGELILVYERMPNGSLDKFLYSPEKYFLNWGQRFQIIKGIASGMFYLHEGWEQVVVHRDIKASNVLLDGEMNARVGDFGLAKLYDHGSDPQTTHVVGTVGYLAPEHYRTGRATTNTDVYAFGAFLLEVVCGKRPIEQRTESEDLILVDWVFSVWSEGRILDAVDRNLGDGYVKEEAELVLKLGLMCSNSVPEARPSMQLVMLYLDGSMTLPDLSSIGITEDGIGFAQIGGFDNVRLFSSSSSAENASISSGFSNSADSVLSGGR